MMTEVVVFLDDKSVVAVRPRPVKYGRHGGGGPSFDPMCIICLSEFGADDDVVTLPCNHTFCAECIATWLSRSRHCPLRCNQVVLPPSAPAGHVDSDHLP